MVEVITTPGIRYPYVMQTPDALSKEMPYQIVCCFHGSLQGSGAENVSTIYDEYERGRWIFSEKVNASCIFLTPIIERGEEMYLRNGLEVDPQRFSRGSMYEACKSEYPDFYAPHLEVKKILDAVKESLRTRCTVRDRIITLGVSAGGSFATRFALLYPNDVAAALSFINEQLFIPLEEYKGLRLPFPFGLDGLGECPDIHITSDSIDAYKKIHKLVLIDREDDSDSLPWDIDQAFFTKFTELFGAALYMRALNATELLTSQFSDSLTFILTSGNGHKVLNEDFDAHIERYVSKVKKL